MLSRYFLSIVLISGFLWASCKQASDSGNGGGTTPASVGDSIPVRSSLYYFQRAQLDTLDNINPATIQSSGIYAFVDSTGMDILGKQNVFFIVDQGDTSYYHYEDNGDVSVYFWTRNFYQIYGNPQNPINQPLEQIEPFVFGQWIRLPIASKDTSAQTIYNGTATIVVTDDKVPAQIYATVKYVNDSDFTIGGKTLTAKHCVLTISAKIIEGTTEQDIVPLTHVRHLWFVPKIGYLAMIKIRTTMGPYPIKLIPQDTTGILKVLTSYTLK